jgi:hypothetical protein
MAEDTPPPSNGVPGRAKGYLAMVMPLLIQGGPIVSLVLLVLGGVTLWYMNGHIQHQYAGNKELLLLLLAEKERRVELALRVGQCESRQTQQQTRPQFQRTWTIVPWAWVPCDQEGSP